MNQRARTAALLLAVAGCDQPAAEPCAVAPVAEPQITPLIGSDTRSGDGFGVSVASAGDVDGDGHADVLLGAPGSDAGVDGAGGAVYLYLGSAVGPDIASEVRITASDADGEARFGRSASGAGDLNGDGYDDVIVGAGGDLGSRGAAYVYLGGPTGLDPETEVRLTIDNAPCQPFSDPCDGFGTEVSSAGDVNGDGFADLIVGAPEDDTHGTAHVYLGGSEGLDADRPIRLAPPEGDVNSHFGVAVAGAGDVNGDGFDDVIVGASGETHEALASGGAYVFHGGADGVETVAASILYASDGKEHDFFGTAVSRAGDLDGDGYDDVIVAAPLDDGRQGSVYVFHGRPEGIDRGTEAKLTRVAGDRLFGTSVGSAGDLDRDGFDDVYLTAGGDGDRPGAVGIYRGNADGLETEPVARLLSPEPDAYVGMTWHGASAGDIDGDGYDDVIVGETDVFYEDGPGSAWVFTGLCPVGGAWCGAPPTCGG